MLPLALYIHFPWCIAKCPYCDFNSSPIDGYLPEDDYISALEQDLISDLNKISNRKFTSIFFGGGTPSIFSPEKILKLIDFINDLGLINNNAEISMEINPGTISFPKLRLLREGGVNRLSIGIQSFQDQKLKLLARIHNAKEGKAAINSAVKAGFTNFNIDLMYGLPEQTLTDAAEDLENAISFNPAHISWYELTIEPDTKFGIDPPALLPNEDQLWEISEQGQRLLANYGFDHYEISAYCRPDFYCQHNLNYWRFGDYLGIGAGAHGKITSENYQVIRTVKVTDPKKYLMGNDKIASEKIIGQQELITEFMLNAARLFEPIPISLFIERTGLSYDSIAKQIAQAENHGLLTFDQKNIIVTPQGKRFLNQLLCIFS